MVALTFDDGPGEQTPEIIDALAGAPATFFVVGSELREHEATSPSARPPARSCSPSLATWPTAAPSRSCGTSNPTPAAPPPPRSSWPRSASRCGRARSCCSTPGTRAEPRRGPPSPGSSPGSGRTATGS
ncbi:polysaccharide deacetylase family protein [Nonomuraea sp. NPDC049649]|uniref:polysaccharide deacetylase family protein n=1 Tax=Nonomuraea sp. NPDC049649 TaxID=3155776 RepID=UPI0034143463